jgi:hypothetical protein
MPSAEHGKAIWTSVNISLTDCGCDCCCKYVLPNDGQGMEYSKKYFINEWTGKEWLRKELADGESVVVVNEVVTQQETTNDGCHCGCQGEEDQAVYNKNYTEYRVVDGELVDVARLIYDNIMQEIQPHLGQLDTQVTDLTEKLNAEIERSTAADTQHDTKDAELEAAVNILNEKVEGIESNIQTLVDGLEQEKTERETKDAELEAAIQAEAATREAKDSELEQAIADEKTAREAKDRELEGKMLTEEGTDFDSKTGILTLKSKEGTNDIEVQFNFNFGTF